jgi:hypothetical protein
MLVVKPAAIDLIIHVPWRPWRCKQASWRLCVVETVETVDFCHIAEVQTGHQSR